ncbi:hypothetical protein Q3G72_000823 [Acer saccharum]|nr:hypothetical protein Q3G72_000823 [Acer saccharum]
MGLVRVFRVAWCKKPRSEIFRDFGCCGGVNNTLAVGAAFGTDFSVVEVVAMAEITRREYEDLARLCVGLSAWGMLGRACFGALCSPICFLSAFLSAPVVVAVCALVCMVVLLGQLFADE